MEVPKRGPPPTPRTNTSTYCGRRLTYTARGFTTPGWPGAIEADEGLLTLQLVARITVEGGSAPRVQVCHTHIPMGWPGREATAQKVGWIRQSRKRTHFPCHPLLPVPQNFLPSFQAPLWAWKLALYWNFHMGIVS